MDLKGTVRHSVDWMIISQANTYINLMGAIPLCDSIEVCIYMYICIYIYIRLYTTSFTILSNCKVNESVVTCKRDLNVISHTIE
jgi:hypothetical protein